MSEGSVPPKIEFREALFQDVEQSFYYKLFHH